MINRGGRSRLIAIFVLALFAALLPWQAASAQSGDTGEAPFDPQEVPADAPADDVIYPNSTLPPITELVSLAPDFGIPDGDSDVEAGERIVNGSVASITEHPYAVQMIVFLGNGRVGECAGTIIRDDWVLSAAHCLDGNYTDPDTDVTTNVGIDFVAIIAGEQIWIEAAPLGPDAQVRFDDGVIVHPNWTNDAGNGFDIALMKLEVPLNLNSMVQPISVALNGESSRMSSAKVVGWGLTSRGGARPVDGNLRKATVSIVSDGSCRSRFDSQTLIPQFSSADIPGSRVICAGGNTKDACQGDSGGPLVGTTGSGEVRLIGIVSWGIGCADGVPGVYTEATAFSDWLFSELPNRPCNGKASTIDVGLGMPPTNRGDRIVGTDRVDVFDGRGGADKICGMGGDDRINGGAGNDVIWGQDGADRLFGNGGNDTIYGGPGADLMIGKDGNDTLRGGDGNDVMKGGTGRDKVYGGNGNDNIQGGDGHDDLRGEAGNDKVKGQNGADTALGGDGNDIIKGGNGRDTVDGQAGDDQVWGKGDDDTVIGGSGNDLLKGGKGVDALDGGAGTDDCDPGGGPGADTFAGCEAQKQ